MIKVNKYEIQLVEVFDNIGNSLGFLNEHEFNDLRCQISEHKINGYYLIFNEEKIQIDSEGRLTGGWPYGLYDIDEILLCRLFKSQSYYKNKLINKNI